MGKSLDEVYQKLQQQRAAAQRQLEQKRIQERKAYEEGERRRLEYVRYIKMNEALTVSSSAAGAGAGGSISKTYLYGVSSTPVPGGSSLQSTSFYQIAAIDRNGNNSSVDNYITSFDENSYPIICYNQDNSLFYYVELNSDNILLFNSITAQGQITNIASNLANGTGSIPSSICYYNSNVSITSGDPGDWPTSGFLYCTTQSLFYVDQNGDNTYVYDFGFGAVATSIIVYNNQIWMSALIFVFPYDLVQNQFINNTYAVSITGVPDIDSYKVNQITTMTAIGNIVYCLLVVEDTVTNNIISVVAQLDLTTYIATYIREGDDISSISIV